MTPATSLYCHLPFCLRKCSYCDFASLPLDEAGGLPAARRYMDAVAIELDRRALSEEFLGCEVDTVYIGGGTPTALPPEWLADLLARLRLRFAFAPDAETTIEANPGTVDEAKFRALLAAGVNRISLGVQSFADPVLQTLGRIHTATEAKEAIAAARAAGCANLSLDLMYGIPNQSLGDWRSTLETAVEAQPDHISVYALSVEPDTPLCAAIASSALPPPDDDLAADMYQLARQTLGKAGFDHYELSNFAQPDKQCRHNRSYWAYDEYLGLGAAAHSFRRGIRWNNLPDPAVYTEWIEAGRLPVERAEALSAREAAGEMLMLGLRRAEGISEREVRKRTGVSVRKTFEAEIARLAEDGLLVVERGRLRIPSDAWLVSNEVLSTFVA
ncbi:MAG: radical SAM family heme chaperone HemW [Armatimonadota bacterium]